MRRAARTDANHTKIVDHLRQCGMSVLSLAAVGKGCPDLAIGFRNRNIFLEVKDGAKCKSQKKLTEDEARFHMLWKGQVAVVETPEEAERVIQELTLKLERVAI